jgi:hypothetical protein
VLKNTSSLVSNPAPGIVYKNINVWVGTSGFARPKNIKNAVVRFEVPDTWLESNNIEPREIKMLRWDGIEWIHLDTTVREKESGVTCFEATSDTFSPLAITGLVEPVSTVIPHIIAQDEINETASPAINEVIPPSAKGDFLPFNLSIMILVLAVIGIVMAIGIMNKKRKVKG